MVRLGDCGKSLSASAIGAWFGCLMEGRDMVGEFGHQGRIQSVSLGEFVEQRRLLESPHHHEPIDHRTLSFEADPTVCGTGNRSDLDIEVGRRAAVERELGLAGDPALLLGRKVEMRKFYRAFKLVGAVAGEKDQRHMGLDDIDPLDCRLIRGRLAQKIDNIALIVGHCSAGSSRFAASMHGLELIWPGIMWSSVTGHSTMETTAGYSGVLLS
jgi:hypothetical protein